MGGCTPASLLLSRFPRDYTDLLITLKLLTVEKTGSLPRRSGAGGGFSPAVPHLSP